MTDPPQEEYESRIHMLTVEEQDSHRNNTCVPEENSHRGSVGLSSASAHFTGLLRSDLKPTGR